MGRTLSWFVSRISRNTSKWGMFILLICITRESKPYREDKADGGSTFYICQQYHLLTALIEPKVLIFLTPMAQVNSFKAKGKKILAPSNILLHVTLLLTLLLSAVKMQAQEMYAVLVDGIATYYYDNNRSAREGLVFSIEDKQIFDIPYNETVKTVIIDDSFSNARPTSTAGWFGPLQNLKTIEGLEKINTSNVRDMNCMFSDCQSLTSLNLSNFDTKNVINMHRMFASCRSLTNLDLSSFDTSKVTNMSSMFSDCKSLSNLDLGNFDTSNVTEMWELFGYCGSLKSLNLSTFNTSNVTSMGYMFTGCSSLTSLDLSKFDTSNVTDMSDMFNGCNSLTSLDLGHFDTSNVTNMRNMFSFCSSLTSLDLNNFDTSNVTNMNFMFRNCSSLTGLDLSNFDTSSITSIGSMFNNCSSLQSITIGEKFLNLPHFNDCRNLMEINSLIKEPQTLAADCFQTEVKNNATLNVCVGTKALYEATEGWKDFKNIVEKYIVPSDGDNTDYGNGEISDETNLNGNVIGNIYYNISDENGEYSSAEGCIILRKPTTDEQMNEVGGMDLFGENLKNNYTGIIFMVQAGSGTIKVNAETVGSMTLKVKIGNNQPVTMELEGKMKASFPYTVAEPTYVYIYGGETASANARAMRRAESTENALKIYGIEWSESDIPSHVEAIRETSPNDMPIIYNLQGQRMQSTSRGINIVNGKKFVVK